MASSTDNADNVFDWDGNELVREIALPMVSAPTLTVYRDEDFRSSKRSLVSPVPLLMIGQGSLAVTLCLMTPEALSGLRRAVDEIEEIVASRSES